MEYEINDIVLHYNGKKSPGYEYIPQKQNNLPIVLLCHGNYKEGKDAELIRLMAEDMAENGFNVVTYDNLCYNKAWHPEDGIIRSSEEIDLRWAAYAAITYITSRFKDRKILIIGHSMGASIALAVGAMNTNVQNIVGISPTRISRFIYDDASLHDFWIQSRNEINAEIDLDIVRTIRFDIMEENYISFLCKKRVLFVCGEKERYFNYKKWLRSITESVGNSGEMKIIPDADHFFGVSPGKEDSEVFNCLMQSIYSWIPLN